MKTTSVLASDREVGHSTRGTSCLLKDRKYTHCTDYMLHSERVTFFWSIFPCHPYDITHFSRVRYIPNLSFLEHQFYEHCQYGKQVVASHPTTTPILLDLVHLDVCGPMPHQSLGGASYFVSFIDDSTRKE